jgi:2-hydroxy-3-oxopropionate reductase
VLNNKQAGGKNMKKIGFIGLGIMGKPMAKNLMRAGYPLTVYDLNPVPCAELAELGATVASSPAGAAQNNEIIFTIVPDSPQVRQVILGENGVLTAMQKGAIVADLSSIFPAVSQEIAQAVEAAGGMMFDAPVSGGEPKAIDGTLSFMVGGPEAGFPTIQEVMLAMGTSVVHIGDNGAGCVCKLANQIIVNLNIAAVSEALVLAVKSGVNPENVYQAIRGGLAGSTVLDAKAPLMFNRQFAPGGRIDINLKDMKNVMNQAHTVDVPLPLSSQLLEILQALKVDGKAGEDHSAIVKYYEKAAQVEVKK